MTAIVLTSLAQYGRLAKRTEKPLPENQRKMHAILGMITENGEFTTNVKRIVIYEKLASEEMVANMLEELGDWCWYAAIAFDSLDAPFAMDETFLPIHWNRKTNSDRLTYCSSMLNSISTHFLMGVDLSRLNDTDQQRQRQEQIRALEQAVATISMTVTSITEGRLGLHDILEANIAKLRARFPDAYSNEAAEARADKGGLSALES